MSTNELRNQYDVLLLEEAILKKLGTIKQLESLRADKELVFAGLCRKVIEEASRGTCEYPFDGEPVIHVHDTVAISFDLIPKEVA